MAVADIMDIAAFMEDLHTVAGAVVVQVHVQVHARVRVHVLEAAEQDVQKRISTALK